LLKLFSPLGKLAGRAIYFALISIFLLWAKLSQYLLDRFSPSFHQMEDICVNFLDQVQFFLFLKGRCHGNQFSGKMGQNYQPSPALITLSIQNGMGYRLANTRIYSSTNWCTSCEKMVKICWVVFKLKWVRKWKLCCNSAKIGLYRQITQQLLNQSLPTFQHS